MLKNHLVIWYHLNIPLAAVGSKSKIFQYPFGRYISRLSSQCDLKIKN